MSYTNLGQQGVLQVIPEAQLQKQDAARKAASANSNDQAQQASVPNDLIGYIKSQFEIFRNHRNTSAGWSERLLISLRIFNGQYDPTTLNEIRRFGGSEVYARVIAQKCRAASSLLRDIYLGQDKSWGIRPPSDPEIPGPVLQNIDKLMQQELQQHKQQGQPDPDPNMVVQRRQMLMESAIEASKKRAADQAYTSEQKIEDILREGNFYQALAEFLVDLPVFPFAVLKGPIVKVVPTVTWPPGGGQPSIQLKPRLTWVRVSPFDIWFTPGVADVENANVIEKSRITRAELNAMVGLPGYNDSEIKAVLEEYGRGGLYDNWDTTDAERAVLESRENPAWNRSGMLSMMEFNGNVQGKVLQDYGLAVDDELRDYHVQVWCIGRHIIKANLSPSPRQRHPYFITSFEKVPGTPVGNSLSDLLGDVQTAANATLRALINNLSIASGPQVVVEVDRLSEDEQAEDLYPWKRWLVRNDPVAANNKPPISFFMPTSNAAQLIQVYQEFIQIADDVSAIPKYVGGQAGAGGAGRTASGLAMLMGNASKILQSVAANIDRDVLEPALLQLADLIMLTDTSGLLTGEEKISVQGVAVAIQRETIRQRQIEFLQATANPMDQQIIGMKGRAAVLRSVANTIGLPGEEIVPNEQEILKRVAQQAKQQEAGGNYVQQVQKGVQQGVEQGVKRIATELTAGGIAAKAMLPEGPPTHLGTPPSPQASNPDMDLAARQAQGGQQGPLSQQGPGPAAKVVGNQPGPGPRMNSPGVA